MKKETKTKTKAKDKPKKRSSSAKSLITVLYENKDVLVINKPAGLIVHSDGRIKEPTVVEWILKNYPKIKGVGDKNEVGSKKYEVGKEEKSHNSEFKIQNSAEDSANLRPGIVHRLDRETSGVLIIAKNQEAFYSFKHQFKKQEVHKTYHAFVYGRMKHNDGLIDRPISRSRANPVLWSATRGRKGEEREAVTEYRVLSRMSPKAGREGKDEYTFVELSPRTGRTHQLRVHLKAVNYPIVSDRLYAPNREPALGFTRLALHSKAISFFLPSNVSGQRGKRITVEAPYPADFKRALKSFKI